MPTSDAVTWWARARDRARGGPSDALDIQAWNDLPHEDRDRIERRVKMALSHEDPSIRAMGFKIAEDLTAAEWGGGGLSDHLRLEIAVAVHQGHPMPPGDPVPGCSCPSCTGISEDHPARAGQGPWAPSESWTRQVDDARSRPLLDVARSLGLEPKKVGRELVSRCPFHDDRTPSLSMNSEKGMWHCFSCGRGGDGIGLVMQVRKLDFTGAVKELAPAA